MTAEKLPVPFLDLGRQYAQIREAVLQQTDELLQAGHILGGGPTEAFEADFARFCGQPQAVLVNSGTSALHLMMRYLGIGPGDEVIVPANSFIATALAVSYVGGTPVFADIDPGTWQMCPLSVAEKLGPNTKAIVAVHLYGQTCDWDALRSIAKRHQLHLVEDASQAHGASYKGRPVGSLGDLAAFSLYPSKNLGTYGQAGVIVCRDAAAADTFRQWRNYGSTEKYHHREIGYNMQVGNFEAMVLNLKLARLAGWNERRREIAESYRQQLPNPALSFQQHYANTQGVHYVWVARTPRRDELRAFLTSEGIQTGLHYPVPCHLQAAYAHLGYQTGSLPAAEAHAQECLSLPMFPELTDAEVWRVIEAVRTFF